MQINIYIPLGSVWNRLKDLVVGHIKKMNLGHGHCVRDFNKPATDFLTIWLFELDFCVPKYLPF